MRKLLACMAFAILAPMPLLADDDTLDGDPEAGKQKAQEVCASCHGLDGNALVAEYPDLAGQNAPYLVYALKAYKNGLRTGGNAGLMRPQAANLSEQDMANLAAYYSSPESLQTNQTAAGGG
ncbi:c-type cytochrome [Modicisalibacter luteus]|uniref:C-type cytochrome n=1 Tax=Modicisalibacter luteus TaxID=453962 RepID=A0ABV7M286_9GAMM|nr:cytochrome c [Halomonas lutea]GHB12604.1 cytochrome c biogenesis protein CcsB [Halomonas lutea]